VFSTYLGGTGSESATALAVDTFQNIYVTGFTNSTNFPTASPLYATSAGGYDAIIARIAAQSTLVVTTASDLVGHSGMSLRAARVQANADTAAGQSDAIVFNTAQMGATTISLMQGQLELQAGTGTITIDGGGQIVVDGGSGGRIFQVDSSAQVVLTG